jgi:hypothetical protein
MTSLQSKWANYFGKLDYVETKINNSISQKFWRRPNLLGAVGGWKTNECKRMAMQRNSIARMSVVEAMEKNNERRIFEEIRKRFARQGNDLHKVRTYLCGHYLV